MKHKELVKLLVETGFETGWALLGETLTVWEHDADPPAPLTRPADQAATSGDETNAPSSSTASDPA